MRFGHPRYIQDKYIPFSEVFMESYSSQLLESIFSNLSLKPNGYFCSERVLFSCLQYLGGATELGSLFSLLVDKLDFVLLQVLFPELCMKSDEIIIYEEDPQEFIRQNHSIIEEFYDVNFMASNIMREFCENRPSETMPVLFDFCIENLNDYASTFENDSSADQLDQEAQLNLYINKHGIMNIFISIDDVLLRNSQLSCQLEEMFMTHVIPEFKSPIGFMRAKVLFFIFFIILFFFILC